MKTKTYKSDKNYKYYARDFDKIELPILFYKDDNGKKHYDFEAMGDELESIIADNLGGALVMISIIDDKEIK